MTFLAFFTVAGISPVKTFAANLDLVFFGSATCDECMRIKKQLLYPMMDVYG